MDQGSHPESQAAYPTDVGKNFLNGTQFVHEKANN